MLFQPFAGHSLGLNDLVGGQLASGYIPAFLRLLVTLRGRKAEPHVRKNIILRYARANRVRDAEVVLRLGIPLLGSLAIPLHRLSIVLWHAIAIGIQDPDIELRSGIALFGKRS